MGDVALQGMAPPRSRDPKSTCYPCIRSALLPMSPVRTLDKSNHRRIILNNASSEANQADRDALLARESSRRGFATGSSAGAEPARARIEPREGVDERLAVSRRAPGPARDRVAAESARRARGRGVVSQGVLAQRLPAVSGRPDPKASPLSVGAARCRRRGARSGGRRGGAAWRGRGPRGRARRPCRRT